MTHPSPHRAKTLIAAALVGLAPITLAAACSSDDESTATDAGTRGDSGVSNAEAGATDAEHDTGTIDAATARGPLDPDTAPETTIDRFSAAAAMLFVRDADNGLPAAGEPIDVDAIAMFVGKGLSPVGLPVTYYNFDVQSDVPTPLYIAVDADGSPIVDQLPIVADVPGDDGYTDFFQVYEVTVPADYVANTLTSEAAILDAGLVASPVARLVNRPIVPAGSTAALHLTESAAPTSRSWYRDTVVHHLEFEDDFRALGQADDLTAAAAYIFVTFNINPGDPGGGPPSGFVTEPGTDQTHNVVQFVPGDALYTPLWTVVMYDNAEFDLVSDFDSASTATTVSGTESPKVNCPVVVVSP